jgi:hypothetical protein
LILETGHWRKKAAETRHFRGLFHFSVKLSESLSLRLNRVTRPFGSLHHRDLINIGENALCARFPQKLAFSRQTGKDFEVLQLSDANAGLQKRWFETELSESYGPTHML